MKKLTVGNRIYVGFSAVLLLLLLLGGLSIYKMRGVAKGAHALEEAYIPEVDISVGIESNLRGVMYENRGYGFTEDEKFYEAGQVIAKEVLSGLKEAERLGQEQDLPGLKSQEPVIRKNVESYLDKAAETHEIIGQLARNRGLMDQAADRFIETTGQLLKVQERKLDLDLEDRILKTTLAVQMMNKVDEARINNFRAQGSGERKYADDALSFLNEALKLIDRLDPITTASSDRELLGKIREAVTSYQKAVANYFEETRKGALADADVIESLQDRMDLHAGVFEKTTLTYYSVQVGKLSTDITERKNKIAWINDIIDMGNTARVNNFKSQALRDPDFMKLAISSIDEMDTIFSDLKRITRDSEDIQMLDATDAASESYKTAVNSFLADYLRLQKLSDERNELASQALEGASSLARRGLEETTQIADDSVASMASANLLITVGLLLALAVGIALAIFITRSINGPLTHAINNLSAGASESSSAANQVSSASQSLAEGASEQAASLEETSSSMEEMTSMVARNLEVAQKTNERAQEARKAADSGIQSMAEMRDRSQAVSSSAKEMQEAMTAIKQSSDSISKIIKTIDEIAFQTNILALNAAVEAARAGEAGAGFAVVADEVRSLARRAAEAAQETSSMIEDSMGRSERGMQVNEIVSKNIADANEKAIQVETVLKTITNIVTSVNEAMGEMEASVREQQDGIIQINTTVSQVNEVTQSNAANAEETASASEEMNSQSVTLLEIVDTLSEMVTGNRLNNSGNGSLARAPSGNRSRIESRDTTKVVKKRSQHSAPEKTFSLPGDFD